MILRLSASFLLILSPFLPILADTVTLKSGQEYRNVKTVLGKSSVTVNTEDGKSFSLPIAEIKYIKSSPVKWASEKNEEVKTAESMGGQALDPANEYPMSPIYPKKRPEFSLLPLTGFIPIWSPAYKMDSSLGKPIGIFFSVSELIVCGVLVSHTANSPKSYYSDAGNTITALYTLYPNLDFSTAPNFATLYYVSQNRHLVKGSSGGYTTLTEWQDNVDRLASGLAILLLADVIVNFVLPDFLWRRRPAPREMLFFSPQTEGWRFTIKNQQRSDGENLYHFGMTNHF